MTSVFSDRQVFLKSDCIALLIPLAMMMFGNSDLLMVIKLWFTIIISGSYVFTFIGINASHHHPSVAHDGDAMK